MSKPPLPIREAFERGWELLWAHFGLLAGSVAFIILTEMFFAGVRDGLDINGPVIYPSVAYVVEVLATSLLMLGYVSMLFRLYDGGEAKFTDLFSRAHRLGTYLLATVLFLVLIMVGSVLLIVPGLVILVMGTFYREALVDRQLGPWESIRVSMTITRGHRWAVAGFLLMTTMLNLVGLFLGGIGLVLTVPVCMTASIHLYRFLFRERLPEEIEVAEKKKSILKTSDPAQVMTSIGRSVEENDEPGLE